MPQFFDNKGKVLIHLLRLMNMTEFVFNSTEIQRSVHLKSAII